MTESLGPGWAPKKPPPNGDPDPAPKPRRYWWRFTLAAVLIIAISAATTATATQALPSARNPRSAGFVPERKRDSMI